jgi:hypothetical protein
MMPLSAWMIVSIAFPCPSSVVVPKPVMEQ